MNILDLTEHERTWCVTGAAGFIGSHLVESLLASGQRVVGLDNFATGHRANLDDVRSRVGEEAWRRFRLIEGDIRDLATCREAASGADLVLHQAALGSVPRSIADPLSTHAVNVDGFVNMLVAARDAEVGRFVYASSSSVYGDHPGLPKVEDEIGTPLSPYAVSKRVDELYARTFEDHYGLQTVGLRYFNVFGPRQDPAGAYAAVIPRWMGQLLGGETPTIHGDGETSRDFCYVANVVQANLRAALAPRGSGTPRPLAPSTTSPSGSGRRSASCTPSSSRASRRWGRTPRCRRRPSGRSARGTSGIRSRTPRAPPRRWAMRPPIRRGRGSGRRWRGTWRRRRWRRCRVGHRGAQATQSGRCQGTD